MKSTSIKFLFSAALAIVTVLILLVVLGIQRLGAASEAVSRSNGARYTSYLLADEMRQSSDDLTRLVRTYVVTGDPQWKAQYQEVIDIRNGSKPRPRGYEKIYWDFRAAGQDNGRGMDRAVALKEGEPPLLGLFVMARATDLPEAFREKTWVEPVLIIRRTDGTVHPEYSAIKLSFGFPP